MKKSDKLTICVDFDGTCTSHEYPLIGKPIGAEEVLKELTDRGHKLVLFTMRSGKEEQDAANWFANANIPLYGVNKNPTQWRWTKSPKAYGNAYIDDAAIGAPLKSDPDLSDRPFVDWIKMKELLIERGIL